MATRIVISRKKEWANRVQQVKVFIDNAEKATIANGGSEEYMVEPGMHTVQCSISWFKSLKLTAQVKDGETKFLVVRSGMKYYTVGYISLLVALVPGLLMRLAGIPQPSFFSWLQPALILPFLLYIVYYFSFGRKKYLLLEEDGDNIFR
jgi:hypothetical protein